MKKQLTKKDVTEITKDTIWSMIGNLFLILFVIGMIIGIFYFFYYQGEKIGYKEGRQDMIKEFHNSIDKNGYIFFNRLDGSDLMLEKVHYCNDYLDFNFALKPYSNTFYVDKNVSETNVFRGAKQ